MHSTRCVPPVEQSPRHGDQSRTRETCDTCTLLVSWTRQLCKMLAARPIVAASCAPIQVDAATTQRACSERKPGIVQLLNTSSDGRRSFIRDSTDARSSPESGSGVGAVTHASTSDAFAAPVLIFSQKHRVRPSVHTTGLRRNRHASRSAVVWHSTARETA